MVLGTSNLYVDLVLTLLVLSIAGTVLATLPKLGVTARESIEHDVEVPVRFVALIVNVEDEHVLILSNPYEEYLNITIVMIDNGGKTSLVIPPLNTTLLELNVANNDIKNIRIIINDQYVLRPEVINW